MPRRTVSSIVATKWNLKPTFTAQTFSFSPPAGAKKVDFVPLAPLSLTFTREAAAIVGAPLTPVSYAGVARRTTRRTVAVASTAGATTAAAATATAQQQQATVQPQAAAAQQQAQASDGQARISAD